MANEFALEPHSGAQSQFRSLDEVIAELAARQHGVVARWQLLRRGFGRRAIGHRLQRQRLHPVQRGVYAVGHRVLSIHGVRMAAVLAAGGGAVLSHRDAAAEWALLQSASGPVHVTAARVLRSRRGLIFHCCRLPEDERTRLDGIPLTTVSRTIFDLSAREPRRLVERALHEAEVRRLGDSVGLPCLIERYPGARGAALLRAIQAEQTAESMITKEGLEDLFIAFLELYLLPRPLTNHWLHVNGRWYELDCVWLEQRVIVELDGYATHSTRRKFESDRARDRALHAAGWRVIRVTWRQLRDEPEAVAADLRRLLAP